MTRDEKVEAVIRAWNDAGPAPLYHERAKAKLWQEWPVLARAVDELARTHGLDA